MRRINLKKAGAILLITTMIFDSGAGIGSTKVFAATEEEQYQTDFELEVEDDQAEISQEDETEQPEILQEDENEEPSDSQGEIVPEEDAEEGTKEDSNREQDSEAEQDPKAEQADKGIAIDAENFPDADFMMYIKQEFDNGGGESDGYLSESEIKDVKKINISGSGVRDFKGIEFFTELEELDCATIELRTLDISMLKNLKRLDCSENSLQQLDVSKNTKLISLNCQWNDLTSIDVRKNTELRMLSLDVNQLRKLDVSKNTKLSSLDCNENQLSKLNVTKNKGLTTLGCSNNKLTVLDVTKNPVLEYLNCSYNNINKLDVTKNPNLGRLVCDNNKLEKLNVTKNLKLERLFCENNKLKNLDITKNQKLEYLWCKGNPLAYILIGKIDLLNFKHDKGKVLKTDTIKQFTLLSTAGTYSGKAKTPAPRIRTMKIINETLTSNMEKELQQLVSKEFISFTADPFHFSNSVFDQVEIKTTAGTIYLQNKTKVLDYFGSNEDISILSIEDSNIFSADSSREQMTTPINRIIKEIYLVQEKQEFFEESTKTFDVSITRGIIFVMEDAYEVAFEKTDPFTETIAVSRGRELLNGFTDIEAFKEGADVNCHMNITRTIKVLQ